MTPLNNNDNKNKFKDLATTITIILYKRRKCEVMTRYNYVAVVASAGCSTLTELCPRSLIYVSMLNPYKAMCNLIIRAVTNSHFIHL